MYCFFTQQELKSSNLLRLFFPFSVCLGSTTLDWEIHLILFHYYYFLVSNIINALEERLSKRVRHYHILRVTEKQKPQSSWREIRQVVRCSHEEAMMAGFAIQKKYKHLYLWMYLEDMLYELRFFNLTAVCENVDLHKPCAPDFMPPILKFYFAFAHYPTCNHIAHCCLLTVSDLIFFSLQPGGCLNPFILARCQPKKGSYSQWKSCFKTSWKSKQNNCNFQHPTGTRCN